MGEVSRTELNQQTARVLARVARGERLTITDRGRPIAQIGPPPASVWDDLVTQGKITPAAHRSAVTLPPPSTLDVTVREIIDDLRGDRE